MKGTRNVTAAQTASGEVAQGVRSFFSTYACLYIFLDACRFENLFSLSDNNTRCNVFDTKIFAIMLVIYVFNEYRFLSPRILASNFSITLNCYIGSK